MNIDVDSNSDFMMQHINGVVSQIHMDFLQKKSIRSGTINGTDGWIKYDLQNAFYAVCPRLVSVEFGMQTWR